VIWPLPIFRTRPIPSDVGDINVADINVGDKDARVS
jgi:hypothetical protein